MRGPNRRSAMTKGGGRAGPNRCGPDNAIRNEITREREVGQWPKYSMSRRERGVQQARTREAQMAQSEMRRGEVSSNESAADAAQKRKLTGGAPVFVPPHK